MERFCADLVCFADTRVGDLPVPCLQSTLRKAHVPSPCLMICVVALAYCVDNEPLFFPIQGREARASRRKACDNEEGEEDRYLACFSRFAHFAHFAHFARKRLGGLRVYARYPGSIFCARAFLVLRCALFDFSVFHCRIPGIAFRHPWAYPSRPLPATDIRVDIRSHTSACRLKPRAFSGTARSLPGMPLKSRTSSRPPTKVGGVGRAVLRAFQGRRLEGFGDSWLGGFFCAPMESYGVMLGGLFATVSDMSVTMSCRMVKDTLMSMSCYKGRTPPMSRVPCVH